MCRQSTQDETSLQAAAATADGADGQQQYTALRNAADREHQQADEDYWDDYLDASDHAGGDDDWHDGLAKTPGRRPNSRHMSNGSKTRPDRSGDGVRGANQQRQQRR